MSQLLLRRLSKLSPRNGSLIHDEKARLFSTSNPYLPLECTGEALPGGRIIANVLLYDSAKQELLSVPGKTVSGEFYNGKLVGASHGWTFSFDRRDRLVSMSDIFNPVASKTEMTMVPLPPLSTLESCQSQVFWNVAMSSQDEEDEDWVVAIKFLGRQLSLCRPRRDLRWTNILTPFSYSNLMYSKRDQCFYLPAPGGYHLLSYDLNFQKDKEEDPKFHELRFRDLPDLPQSEWELLLGSCCKTEYLVESAATGEHFLVKWYAQSYLHYGYSYITKRFMVFREEETLEGRYMCYTEDIGDMCIFLSNSEAFCVQASSFPGLKSNSIYFIGKGFGIYDLTSGSSSPFECPEGAPATLALPYWFPPFSF
ncbi:hypothetical protein Bca4012_056282 [Brassica carinata]